MGGCPHYHGGRKMMGVYIVMKKDDGWVSTLPGRKMMGGCHITREEGR